MTVRYWQNVDIDVQNALASATTISAITKAAPPVVTSTAHGYSDGDYLVLAINGMRELNNRVARVDNKTTDDYELEGLNSTNFGTFTSGTAQKITFGASLSTITAVQASGGDPEFDDQTTVHDDVRIQAPTVNSPFQLSMESIWDPADAGLLELKLASDTKTTRAVRITFSDGAKLAVVGYVACTLIPTGSAPGKVTTQITITGLGRPDVWST